jgi:hypothetical protein
MKFGRKEHLLYDRGKRKSMNFTVSFTVSRKSLKTIDVQLSKAT